MKRHVVAIHQPNFFPWLGFFDKFARSDTFVLLDHVQLPGASGSWVNRVRLLVAGEARWVTAPVIRCGLHQSILDTRFDERSAWRRKLIATLQTSYGRAPFFAEATALLEPVIRNLEGSISEYNIRAILTIAAALGLDTQKVLRSSQMEPQGSATALLIDLTQKAGGTAYMCGGGANYQEDNLLKAAGLDPLAQHFEHPTYDQHLAAPDFVAGLSVIDALMQVGIGGTAALLHRHQNQ